MRTDENRTPISKAKDWGIVRWCGFTYNYQKIVVSGRSYLPGTSFKIESVSYLTPSQNRMFSSECISDAKYRINARSCKLGCDIWNRAFIVKNEYIVPLK